MTAILTTSPAKITLRPARLLLLASASSLVLGAQLICPLLSGPISILELVTKEEWNGEEAQAGRNHRQAA
jgi:hypothetical protein